MAVYYSGSIGVQVYRLLMTLVTSDDDNIVRKAQADLYAMEQLGMLDIIQDRIPEILVAVVVSLFRMDDLN